MAKLIFSLSVMVIGMAVVFVGLFILIFAIIIASKIIKAAMKKKETPVEKAVPAPVAVEPIAQAEPETDQQLIAVITAAIMAMQGSASSGLVVRSVVRSGNAWARAGRNEILGNR